MGTGYGKAQKLRYSDILLDEHVSGRDSTKVREWLTEAGEMRGVVRATRRAMAEVRHPLDELPEADLEMKALAAAFGLNAAVIIMGFLKREAGKDRWLLSPTNSYDTRAQARGFVSISPHLAQGQRFDCNS
eukprot:819694-Amphidinium_carterae.2